MIQHTTESLLPEFDRVLFAILREHDEKFHSSTILKKLFPKCEILILEEVTKGQAETVTKMLEYFDVKSSFLVKDADAYFEISSSYESNKNYISLCNAKKLPNAKLYNKSFADISDQNYILRTSLDIISNYFSWWWLFFFRTRLLLLRIINNMKKCKLMGEFFISNIIDVMIDEGHIFHPMECTNYEDLGTYEVWERIQKNQIIIFL